MPDYTQQWLAALKRTHPPQPLTPDAQFLAETGANARPLQTAQAQLPENVTNAASQYGYTTDATGAITGVDTSNPYSRASLLQRSYENSQRGNTNSAASRGQLYSGALQNDQEASFRGFNQGMADNRRSYEDTIRGFYRNLQTLGDNQGIADAGSLGGLTERTVNNPDQVQIHTSPLAPVKSFFAGQSYKPKKKPRR